ncbi:DUF2076 domain-containing protein [Microvirga makkahensis]|uniref:DUF2076 family protein n=1 Tax=Microvirga makkahensis TaxID=1128670 RepID=A0A7X3MVS9_9HYPH|nr:DUF2076 domain-containing protein [Microvirga makkahensis]MXQ14086.1 DUF2076 family protein [Microvirga makkahensis]
MDHQDRQAIEQLFGRLAQVERQSTSLDAQAADFIRARIGQQPNAPYYMAQTIVVQEQALSAAHGRIQQLEQELANRPAGGAGFLAGLFGGGQPRSQPQQQPYQPQHGMAPPMAPGMGGMAPRPGGGFLAGAAQTAMGVAGGVLLGNMIASAFSGGDEAGATDAAQPEPQQAATEDFGDTGEDFGFEDV